MSQTEALSTAIGELLLEILPCSAGIRNDLSLREQGFDSMTTTRLWLELQARFGVDVPPEWLAAQANVDELVTRIAEQLGAPATTTTTERLHVHADPDSRHHPFPLTPIQESYVMGKQAELTGDAVGCHQYIEFEVRNLDVERLRRAWQRLVEHHDMLRTVVTADGMQRVLPQVPPVSIRVHDLTPLTPAEAEGRVNQVRQLLSRCRYEAGEWPLFTIEVSLLKPGAALVHLSLDLLITDGHGLALILEQWHACYEQPGHALPDVCFSARDCVTALRAQSRTPTYQSDLEYWLDTLRDLPPGPDVTPARLGPEGFARRALEGVLPAGQWRALRERAEALKVSPSALVLALFAQALRRCTHGRPFSLVVTTNVRPWLPAAAEHLVGPFTSSAVIIADDAQRPVKEAARQFQQRLWEALQHASVSGVTALRQVRSRERGRAPVALPVVFTSLLGVGPGGRQDGGFGRDVTFAVCRTSEVSLEHQIWERGGELCYRWDVTPERFPAGAMETTFAAFENSLRTFCLEPGPLTHRPLNDLQQAYYVARASGPQAPWNGCQIYESFEVNDLDLPKLERALLRLVEGYEALRTVVGTDGRLEVSSEAPGRWSIPVIDLDGVEDPAASMASIRDEMAGCAFSLGVWPPFDLRVTRFGGGATVHCSFDLAVLDARSIHLLCHELFRLYDDPKATPRAALPPGEDLSAREATERDFRESYWEGRLAHLPPGPALPAGDSTVSEPRRIRLQGRLSGWSQLARLAEQHHVEPDMLLLAAFLEVLSCWLGDHSFAVPVVRFPASAEPYRPGEFTALSWVERTAGGSLAERAATYQGIIVGDLSAGDVSGLRALRRRVMRERGKGDFAFPVVYTTVVDLTDSPLPSAVRQGGWLSSTPDVSLDCIGIREGEDLFFCWDAVERDFTPGQLATMFGEYRLLLERLARGDLEVEGRAESAAAQTERERILYAWNDTATSFPTERLMHQLFEERAAERPDAVALRGRGWTRSYAELNREANRIAWHLKARGVGPETVVGITIRRGPSMVAACLGVLKAGGVYLPVEPSLPQERAAMLLSEARAAMLLTTSTSLEWQVPSGTHVVYVDGELDATGGRDGAADSNPAPVGCPDNTAYIIFTSGSTGKPKGVAVAHRAVLNLLHWCERTFDFGVDDLGLCVTSLGFDLSVFDIFGLLGVGGALYVADETEMRDPQLLLDIMLGERITFWNSAPTSLGQLTPLLSAMRGSAGTDALRLVFLSGDYTPLSLPDDIRAAFPRARVVSLGGATEAAVWSNFFPVEQIDPAWRSIPYGRPIDNARYHVLDAELEPCPVGVEGDLYIGGECLSQGYYRRPGLTAERFIPDPFAREPGRRLYRTGDRACYFPDGNLCFLGRVDGQVKIRGFRVELGEVEHCLRRHPGVKEAVVVVRPDQSGDRKLVAYVVAAGRPRPDVRELRAYASQALPDYMVPNFIAFVDAFPATPNGKLDREALPWPLDEGRADTQAAPSRAAQLGEEIASLFAELLGLVRFDPRQDMWYQGATSFTVVQVSNALHERYGRRIPVSAVLADPTVEGIARWLMSEMDAGAAPAAPAPRLAPASRADKEPDEEPGPVDFFSEEERRRFKQGRWGLRPLSPDEPVIPLRASRVADEYYGWRASRRDLLAGPVPYDSFCRLLGLLNETTVGGRKRRLYPSAGDTFAVQVYLHVCAGGVEGLEPGVYYYRPDEHALQLVCARPELDRRAHFYYNRPLFDAAAFELYLVGQTRGIEPVYGENAERYLALEAGHISQLLMMGQAACQIGLCPIGDLALARIRDQLGLDAGHRFLLSMLGGRAEHVRAVEGTGETPPFAERKAVTQPAEAATQPVEVAVVGMAGRYPGADDPEALWQQLVAGVRATGPPSGHQKVPADVSVPPSAGLLERIDEFDSLLFHISPAEAATLDPQLRLLLETVWACLENAGHSPASLRRAASRVGVVVGAMWQDYRQVGAEVWEQGGEALVSGSASDIANRVSRYFDFQGPSLAVDAACTSSLAAIHLAAESIRRGECGAVVVGAVNLLAHPYHFGLLSGLGLAATGEVSGAFDADSSGWVPGEGVAAVLLRPAAAAIADGDVIHGVIEATAIGHAGRLGAADPDSLAASVERMLAGHGLAPADISYIECAAAGASVADAAEVEALARVFGDPCRGEAVPFGTLKANVGHMEAAAGLSQLTKVLLQMRHRQIAPTKAAARRNPLVDWNNLPLRLADGVQAWQSAAADAPLRALINAVGADGAYGHLVIRSAPPREPVPSRRGELVVVLSAASRQQLVTLARRLRDHLVTCRERGAAVELANVAFTLQTGRVQLAHRLAIPCSDISDLLARLDAFVQGRPTEGELSGVAAAWVAGQEVDWHRLWTRPARRVSLPTYPFARQSHWLQSVRAAGNASRRAAPTEGKRLPLGAPAAPDGNGRPASVAREVEENLLRLYAEISGIALEDLDARVPLEHYGLSSLLVTRLNTLLERDFGALPRTLLYEHRTLAEVAERLSNRQPEPRRLDADGDAPAEAVDRRPGGRPERQTVDVAIIGIAGRYPQARDLRQFWANLISGRDCITALPPERRQEGWPVELMWGGYLDEVDRFDSLLFNITPREADLMSPQERLFLEVVWEALDDAGYPRRRLRERHGSCAGVYVGSMYNEYPFFGVERSVRGEPVSAGAGLADIANRVSYFFDLRGPSMTVDTLCSSSLTCVHLAVESLRRGECEVAIVGGVNLSLHPNKFVEQARHQMPSSDHRCRSFGAGGDGFVPGEGVGAVLLKPLHAALADGDRIHAVIKGTALNHGGRTSGYMVPNPSAQAELIRDALHTARIPAASISYVEAHGTGTELGDPIEINGMERAFAGEKPASGYWPVGSVKSSIGHLEGAAGIASLTKVVLQLRYKLLAPSLHAEHLNPNVDWERSPFQVQRQVAEWHAPRDERGRPIPRRAAISSFGAGGANAHVIVEEYAGDGVGSNGDDVTPSAQLIVLSARDEERLRAAAGALAAFLGQQLLPLSDIAYTLQVGREHLRERLAVVVSDLAGLRETLNRFRLGDEAGALRGRAPAGAPANTFDADAPGATEPLDLFTLGRRWVNGGLVDWSRLHGSRRPSLVSLPSYPFARRQHWVPWEASRSEITPVSPVPPVPVHNKTWMPADDDKSSGRAAGGEVLCLFHEGSEAIARRLADEIGPGRVTLLREGPDRGDGIPAYADEASGQAAVGSILARHPSIAAWVDLCDLYRRDDEPGPWLARLAMLQRLLGSQPAAALRLLHVTRGLQGLQGPPPGLAGARVAGLIRMLRSEHRRVAATTMDTDVPEGEAADAARQIAAELRFARPPEICYRRGRRYRPELSAVTQPEQALRLDPEQVYIVTGGTRGLGALVARRLLERGAHRLALTGLRTLPTREHWDDPGLPQHEVEAIRTLRDLEHAGAKVELYCGALTERVEVEAFLARARGMGEIGGVVHCAGRMPADRCPFVRRDLAELQAVFEPKVEGLEVLAELCSRDRPSFFLLFSSVAGSFPALAAGAADYAAANAFMDWFAGCQARKGRHWFRSVAWPSWRGAGMHAPEPPAYARLGLSGLDVEQGLRLLEATLCWPSGETLLVCPGRGAETEPSALLEVCEDAEVPEVPSVRRAPDADVSVPAWLVTLFAKSLGMSEAEMDPEVTFGDLGVESVLLAELLRKIEGRVGRPLEPTMLLEHPTLARLSAALVPLGLTTAPEPPPRPGLRPCEQPVSDQPINEGPYGERQIAVIGVACRFPGASSPAEFWANLREGRSAIAEVPASRWDCRALYRPHFEMGKSVSKWGGFIEGIEDFDPSYFRMSDEEATCLDPAIRLMLEGVETCLAEAGYNGGELSGRDVGVFVGARVSDYWRRAGARPGSAGFGSDQNFIAARVAHHLNLTGPNFVVDSACSSSLVGVQLAVRSLLAGESELALVGGVDVLLDERPYVEFSAARALSPTGRCYVFDERADGFVPGEGCGVLLLKRLDRALRDGDRIHAVIEAVAVNNDGRTVGLTTPNPAAQAAVIRRALEQSGLRAEDIAMVEAHGTGTMLGDPMELRALTEAFGRQTGRTGICAVGSVKSNLGHLLSAAGIAGLLKVVLSLEHGEIPPTLFCERPNPRFDFERSPFYPNTELRPWPADRPLRAAGVSAFGLGGTNAHLIATALDPRVRADFPQIRSSLPPPTFQRRRLWLDGERAAGEMETKVARDDELVTSILDLEFVGNGRGAM